MLYIVVQSPKQTSTRTSWIKNVLNNKDHITISDLRVISLLWDKKPNKWGREVTQLFLLLLCFSYFNSGKDWSNNIVIIIHNENCDNNNNFNSNTDIKVGKIFLLFFFFFFKQDNFWSKYFLQVLVLTIK